MRIHDMFEKDIDRQINGVVKVAQEDDANLEQELSEYVVTRELAQHFEALFDAYEAALAQPTDRVGVWISGFFGSGKSHFLKMLSYLLTNRAVAGRRALDYFDGKFGDPALFEQAARCAAVPAEAILFNIDSKNVGTKDKDALKRVFARVFYDHLGFYGEELKLARLEQFIDQQGKTKAFRAAYERINGEPWLDTRDSYCFFSDDVIDALSETGVMSADEAERWFNSSDEAEFSIDALTDEICAYARRRARETGGAFRLLFCVDEVGQYINNGKDVDLMLNLQTIVEELGAKGMGSVWVMVTSQEAIDEVVSMAGTGNDFSKIQGRFNTRLSLSSSRADEVIKRRVLAKNEHAADLLRAQYAQQRAVLNNLFTFKNAVGDLAGYEDAEDFAQTFPFANYQFKVLQKVLNEIRKHGSSGKHTSGGERSMLSGFQEAAQAVEDRDEFALVPFWRFYDTVQTFLEGHVRRVITRAADAAANGKGLEPVDVEILKLLFLIRWVDDVESNPDNITVLMTSSMTADRLQLRADVAASLDRLVRQNYVSRSGETYQFLTDDEQEIAREISNTPVDAAAVTKMIGDIVFGEIFDTPKLKYGENDFPVQCFVDETRVSGSGELVLRVMTAASAGEDVGYQQLMSRSDRGEAICLLSDDARYFTLLQEAARIDRYVRLNNGKPLPDTQRRIIKSKRDDAHAMEREARGLIEAAIRDGEFYALGDTVKPAGSNARQMLTSCLERLVDRAYPKLSYIDVNYKADAEVTEILRGARVALDGQQPNARAIEAMDAYLENQARLHIATSMEEVQKHFQAAPFGWRQIDIAAVAAELLVNQQARLRYGGAPVDLKAAKCIDYLRRATEARSAVIEKRVSVSEADRRAARETVEDLTGAHDLPLDEGSLAESAWAALSEQKDALETLLRDEYRHGRFPGRETVERVIKLLGGMLAAGQDPSDLLPAIAEAADDADDILDDLEDVQAFFKGGDQIWAKAVRMRDAMARETGYLRASAEATQALRTIDEILDSERPYRRVRELGPAMQAVQEVYDGLLDGKRAALLQQVESIYADVERYAQDNNVSLAEIERRHLQHRDTAHSCASLTDLDALSTTLGQAQSEFYAKVDDEVERRKQERAAKARREAGGASAASVVTTEAAAQADTVSAASPEPPALKLNLVSRTSLCPPKTLRTPEDIDAFLSAMRAELLRNLDGYNAVRIGQ